MMCSGVSDMSQERGGKGWILLTCRRYSLRTAAMTWGGVSDMSAR